MADGTRRALGLSIGATTLAAVTADHAVTRKPVLTLYEHRAPEVGVPSENPNLDQPGVVIADFVDRVADAGEIVATDGSRHRSQAVIAEALRALAHAATGGQPLPEAVAASYPAHWQPAAVDALRAALGSVPEWSHQQVTLFDDATAAMIALTANPGLPNRGIVAMCDFGGSGTSLTLLDAANGYRPVAGTVRHTGFSGDMIDQALLNHVVAELSSAGSFDTSSTSAIGSLTRLRADCRRAKELLSSSTTTTVTADLPGFRGDVQLTRSELDAAIRGPLDAFVAVLRESLQHNGIRAEDLAAVASFGGSANIPTLTTTLSENLRVPVVTAARPQLTAAIGAALRAASAPADDASTAMAPTAEAAAALAEPTMMAEAARETGAAPALAWSETDDDSDSIPLWTGEYPTGEYPEEPVDAGATALRPQTLDHEARPTAAAPATVAWYRRTPVVVLATALAVLAIVAAVVIALRNTSGSSPTTPTPSVSTSPGSPGSSQPSDTNQPPSSTSSATNQPAPSSQSTTSEPSSSTETSSSTQSTTTAPSTSQTTTQTPFSPPSRPILPFPLVPGGPGPGGPGGGGPGGEGPGGVGR